MNNVRNYMVGMFVVAGCWASVVAMGLPPVPGAFVYNHPTGQFDLSAQGMYNESCSAMATVAARKLMYLSDADMRLLIDAMVRGQNAVPARLMGEILTEGMVLYDQARQGRLHAFLSVDQDLPQFVEGGRFPIHILGFVGDRYEVEEFMSRSHRRISFNDTTAFYTSISEQLEALSVENGYRTVAAALAIREWVYALVYRPGIGFFFFDSHQQQLDIRMLLADHEHRGSMLLFSPTIRSLVQTLINFTARAREIAARRYPGQDELFLRQAIIPGHGGYGIFSGDGAAAAYVVPRAAAPRAIPAIQISPISVCPAASSVRVLGGARVNNAARLKVLQKLDRAIAQQTKVIAKLNKQTVANERIFKKEQAGLKKASLEQRKRAQQLKKRLSTAQRQALNKKVRSVRAYIAQQQKKQKKLGFAIKKQKEQLKRATTARIKLMQQRKRA